MMIKRYSIRNNPKKVATRPVETRPLLTMGLLAYNKGPYIKVLLDQIISQMAKDKSLWTQVEVIVSDNASTDSTPELMKGYMKMKLPYLRYNRNRRNVGLSGNIFKQIELAKGRYLWLMGDDEILPGGIKRLMGIIRKYDGDDNIFLMSIQNIPDKKVWLSSIDKDAGFIYPNSANLTTNVLPVGPAKRLIKDFHKVNEIWPHTQVTMLLSAKYGCKWVLVHNDIFRYMTHFRGKFKSHTLVHLMHLDNYYNVLLRVDKAANSRLFYRINKTYEFFVLIPFLDTITPKYNKRVRQEIKRLMAKYDIKVFGSICYLLLLIPAFIRKRLFDLAYLIYGRRYTAYRKMLEDNAKKT